LRNYGVDYFRYGEALYVGLENVNVLANG